MPLRHQLRHVSLLDCTLRDGGYYTAWDFPNRTVDAYLEAMSRLPVATVELGYCHPPGAEEYFGRYYFLTATTTAAARARLAGHQRLAVMLDEKSIAPSAVPALLAPHHGIVDLVRIAVAPDRLAHAVELATAISEAGFAVGVNVMYLSRYWDRVGELPGLAGVAEIAEAVSLVDSYGACYPDEVSTAVAGAVAALPDVAIGFHGHDNLGLAYANSLAAADAGATVIDATLTGMGRGPGNTAMELLLVQVAASANDFAEVDALDQGVRAMEELKERYRWGTNLAYMISGASGLPQKDVMDWLGKSRYSLTAIVRALGGRDATTDSTAHPEVPPAPSADTEVLVIGGGQSVRDHLEAIAEYASTRDAVVLHANYRHLDLVPDFGPRQYVCIAGEAAARLPSPATLSHVAGLVVPSGVRYPGATPHTDAAPILQAEPFRAEADAGHLGPVPDTAPLSLALGTAIALGAGSVTLLGFDGYENATTAQQELTVETQEVIDAFRRSHPEVALTSGTRTRYAVPTVSIYGRGPGGAA
jgi:4-hydroxy 2-oxovalerate aldolase